MVECRVSATSGVEVQGAGTGWGEGRGEGRGGGKEAREGGEGACMIVEQA